MCTYNGAAFLRQQLESIAAQTRQPDELVVCDDVSSDATREIVEAFAAAAPFPVRFHANDERLGSTKNFERAIGLCAGDLVALCDQDDIWHPEKLERTEQVFASSRDVGAVFTDAEVVDENLRPLGYRLWQRIGFDATKQKRIRDGQAFDLMSVTNVVTGTTLAFRSEYRKLFLPIPTDAVYIHDGWIAVMIAAVARLAAIDESLLRYRQHSAQQQGVTAEVYERAARGDDGLRERRVEALRAATARRDYSFDDELQKSRKIYERLAARQASFPCASSLAKIKRRLAHLEARSAMPGGKFRRMPRVLRELFTFRYHQFSNGLRSAARDLFFSKN